VQRSISGVSVSVDSAHDRPVFFPKFLCARGVEGGLTGAGAFEPLELCEGRLWRGERWPAPGF